MEDLIVDAIRALGLFGVAALMFLENIFPPIPSEFIMPLAGYLSAQEELHLWGAIVMGSLGSIAGTSAWYLVGRRLDQERVQGWIGRRGIWLGLEPEDVRRATEFFRRHGRVSVILGRLVPVVRTLISVPAGFSRMPLPEFLLFSAIGTLIWTGLLAHLGRVLGDQFPQIGDYIGIASWLVVGGAFVLYVRRVLVLRRRRSARGAV